MRRLRGILAAVTVLVAVLVTGAVASVAMLAGPASGGTFPGISNRKLAFGDVTSVSVVNADGSGLAVLTTGYEPSWNVDGSMLAFGRGRHIWIIGADGTGERQLTSGSDSEYQPSWSPDGTKIAFMSDVGGVRRIEIIDVASGSITRMTTAVASESFPAWSPDGTRIAYRGTEGCSVGGYCILVHDLTTSTSTTVLDSTSFEGASMPNWSPDGTKLVFVYDDDPNPSNYSGGIASCPVSACTPTALTADPATDDENPAWAPDGSKIAFLRGSTLRVMDPDGTNVTTIPGAAPEAEYGLSWAGEVPPSPTTTTASVDPAAPRFTG